MVGVVSNESSKQPLPTIKRQLKKVMYVNIIYSFKKINLKFKFQFHREKPLLKDEQVENK